ncbi:unnamed protein product [Ixodes pacificus]
MSEDGRITIRGRIKDLIIRGGVNIYPPEIESLLYTHSHVLDVQVVGVPDSRLGEEVCAWIILKPGKSLSEEDVKGLQIIFCCRPAFVLISHDVKPFLLVLGTFTDAVHEMALMHCKDDGSVVFFRRCLLQHPLTRGTRMH